MPFQHYSSWAVIWPARHTDIAAGTMGTPVMFKLSSLGHHHQLLLHIRNARICSTRGGPSALKPSIQPSPNPRLQNPRDLCREGIESSSSQHPVSSSISSIQPLQPGKEISSNTPYPKKGAALNTQPSYLNPMRSTQRGD